MNESRYRTLISREIIDSIYEQILRKMIVEKRYREQGYTAAQLAREIGTNTRYISAAVNLRFGMNFSSLLGGFRLRDAIYMLTDRRYRGRKIEDIARECGFSNRQSFYTAFQKDKGMTPKKYQEEFFARQADKKKTKTNDEQ